jgi:hypothetical protein
MRTLFTLALTLLPLSSPAEQPITPGQATATLAKAATFYRSKAASHGGYVYYYAPDLSRRLGEGAAGPDEIWVQEPGTPAVGFFSDGTATSPSSPG